MEKACEMGICRSSRLRGARGLPQGDPWAPVALALLLSLPAQHVKEVTPGADTLLCVDDRTVLAKSVPELAQASDTWERLGEVTRHQDQKIFPDV